MYAYNQYFHLLKVVHISSIIFFLILIFLILISFSKLTT